MLLESNRELRQRGRRPAGRILKSGLRRAERRYSSDRRQGWGGPRDKFGFFSIGNCPCRQDEQKYNPQFGGEAGRCRCPCRIWRCGCSSVGRAQRCQRCCRGFESHHPLLIRCTIPVRRGPRGGLGLARCFTPCLRAGGVPHSRQESGRMTGFSRARVRISSAERRGCKIKRGNCRRRRSGRRSGPCVQAVESGPRHVVN